LVKELERLNLKVIQFKEQAEKLNISVEAARGIVEKAFCEGKIFGIITPEKAEAICYESEEIQTLIKELSSGRVSLNNLAIELDLNVHQVRLFVQHLINTNQVSGVLTYNDYFISNKNLKNARLKVIQARKRNHRLKQTRIRH
jgi:hypothetical protein